MSTIKPLTEQEAKEKFKKLVRVTLNVESPEGLESFSDQFMTIAKGYAKGQN